MALQEKVLVPLSPPKNTKNQRFTLVFLCPKPSQACLNEGIGHKKLQDAEGGLVFDVFWNGSPSRDLLSVAKKIPATKAAGI